jgi:hypothetical protein
VFARLRYGIVLVLAAGVFGACAPRHQRLTVETLPRGAEVYLQRSGEVEVEASAMGFSGSFDAGSFAEGFYSLGTTPIDYEFLLEDQEAAVSGGPARGEVMRRYTEGRIRVVMDGYRTVERVVRFTGNHIDLELDLLSVGEQ